MMSEETEFKFHPIGHIKSWYKSKNGTPRQPTICKVSRGIIKLVGDPKSGHNEKYALSDLDQFSHIWILFVFHQNGPKDCVKTKVAPPKLIGNKRVGLYSTRSPHRPNPIGLTLAKMEKILDDEVHITEHDLIDGTPVLDIKPYIPDYDNPNNRSDKSDGQSSVEVRTPSWINSTSNDLKVQFTTRAAEDLAKFSASHSDTHKLELLKDRHELKTAIENILEADPRSAYRKDKCSDRLYFFTVDCAHVTAWFDEDIAEVLRIKPL